MPRPGKAWRHVIISTHGSWLPGDPRGFRNRRHRIHSSGDYRDPPPPAEHAGLYRYNKARSATPVVIPPAIRSVIGQSIVQTLSEENHRVLALSVSGMHTHFLVELPTNLTQLRAIVGRCKCNSSRAVRKLLPGKVWAEGGKFLRVRSNGHQQSVFAYILTRQGPSGWTWSFRNGPAGSDGAKPEEALDLARSRRRAS
jgi:REP element-mobilizing transposase RayT